jgi:type II secretory pathway pseudopilin PulG
MDMEQHLQRYEISAWRSMNIRMNNGTDNGGMVLVELMVAMVILLLVSMALMQTALVSIDANTRNVLRDEAVRLAEAKMDELRNRDYPGSTTVVNSMDTVEMPVRNMMNFAYIINTAKIDTANSQMTVTVDWEWRDDYNSHTITTIRSEE